MPQFEAISIQSPRYYFKTTMTNTIVDNHVRLVLHRSSDFYLEIPIAVVENLVLKPYKFLRYLGWSILGIPGDLQDTQGVAVDLEGTELIPNSTYRYHYQDTGHLVHYILLTLSDQSKQIIHSNMLLILKSSSSILSIAVPLLVMSLSARAWKCVICSVHLQA